MYECSCTVHQVGCCRMVGSARVFVQKVFGDMKTGQSQNFQDEARLTNNDTQFVKLYGLRLLHTETCRVITIRISGLLTTAWHIAASNIVKCKYKSERLIEIIQNAKCAKWALHEKVWFFPKLLFDQNCIMQVCEKRWWMRYWLKWYIAQDGPNGHTHIAWGDPGAVATLPVTHNTKQCNAKESNTKHNTTHCNTAQQKT